MLHEDIQSVAHALNAHKDRVPESEGDTWRLLHNAVANLNALAASARQMEAHFAPVTPPALRQGREVLQ